MRLRSLALEFAPPQSGPRALRLAVEQALAGYGQPLRWAITQASSSSVRVEAVVLDASVLDAAVLDDVAQEAPTQEGAEGEPVVGARELP